MAAYTRQERKTLTQQPNTSKGLDLHIAYTLGHIGVRTLSSACRPHSATGQTACLTRRAGVRGCADSCASVRVRQWSLDVWPNLLQKNGSNCSLAAALRLGTWAFSRVPGLGCQPFSSHEICRGI